MAIPGSKAPQPDRTVTLEGHDNYDDNAWAAFDAVQVFNEGPHTYNGTDHLTLASIVEAIWVALKRVKVTGSANLDSPVVTPIGDDTSGIALGGASGALVAAGSRALSWSTTVVEVYKAFTLSDGTTNSASARGFMPGLTQDVSTAPFLRRDPGGELIVATSRRALKTNERRITNGLEVIRRIQPKWFDKIDGTEQDIPGFIAEDLHEVGAKVATIDENGPSGVQLEAIVSYLVAAVQDLADRLDAA